MRIEPGSPNPLGATWDGSGTNFSLFSANAEKVELCLFEPTGRRETHRIPLPERTHDNDLWHVTGLEPGRHTVRVVARGDADPRSKGTEVRIDWAIVYGAQAAP